MGKRGGNWQFTGKYKWLTDLREKNSDLTFKEILNLNPDKYCSWDVLHKQSRMAMPCRTEQE